MRDAYDRVVDQNEKTLSASLEQAEALLQAEKDRLAIIQLEQEARYRERNERILILGLSILTPLLGLALWLLYLRQKLIKALGAERDRSARLARTDPLTGLSNRRDFQTHLAGAHAGWKEDAQAPYSVLIFDIDHFKRINDQHGHACGDEVLVLVANSLRELAEPYPVGRWGGEEFVVLVQDGISAAMTLAEDIRTHIERTLTDPPITLSGGAAEVRVGERIEDVIARADLALYRSKNDGRNQVTPADS